MLHQKVKFICDDLMRSKGGIIYLNKNISKNILNLFLDKYENEYLFFKYISDYKNQKKNC